MRCLSLSLLLCSVAVLTSCASTPPPSCDVANVPAGAVFGAREGMDIATWPAAVPHRGMACQRVWHGERSRPEAMQVLATYYYEDGHVRRLVGRVPGGASYDCHYQGGQLERSQSQNVAQCPKASDLK